MQEGFTHLSAFPFVSIKRFSFHNRCLPALYWNVPLIMLDSLAGQIFFKYLARTLASKSTVQDNPLCFLGIQTRILYCRTAIWRCTRLMFPNLHPLFFH